MTRRSLTITLTVSSAVLLTLWLMPAKIGITGINHVASPPPAAVRILADSGHWAAWWPDTAASGKFFVNNFEFRVAARQNNSVSLVVARGENSWNMSVQAVSLQQDQTALVWQTESSARYWTGKPFNLIQARHVRSAMQQVMDRLQRYLSDPDHVYGIHITTGTTLDSFLISSLVQTAEYPTTKIIYDQIDSISAFVSGRSAVITGFPMINITSQGEKGYRTQAALPIDRLLTTTGTTFFSRQLVPGYFLIGDVTGGQGSVRRGLEQMSNYLSDEQRIQMAIPFYSLISNRKQQPDSANWRTRIYLPVMK